MLIVFLGTSCSGKSTVMSMLHDIFSWNFIGVFTTRDPRDNDVARTQLTAMEFSHTRADEIVFQNCHFGHWYGWSRSHFEQAVGTNSSDLWMVDFSAANLHQLKNVACTIVLILPENREQLIRQIQLAGRSERINHILEEYDSYIQHPLHNSFINHNGRPIETATVIDTYVRSLNP